jgi:N-acetylglucosamine-6-phosphate deacetylase
MIALTAGVLFTPHERIERPLLLLEGETIVEVTSRAARDLPREARSVDLGDAVLAPGFIDIHIHGGAGYDVMQSDPDGLAAMERFLVQHGVCSYFPTTVTAPVEAILRALEWLADVIEAVDQRPDSSTLRAQPRGIHLEGPFLSHARRGVHPPDNLLPPTPAMFDRLWQASRGHIRIMTIAAELDGAREVIAQAASRGVCVSLGHTDADLTTSRAAVAAGARHATHTYNAMRPLGHRDPGIVGAVLSDSRLTADIIADGIHVDPVLVQLFLNAKGSDLSVLITDAISATGMPDGTYHIGTIEVEVKQGRCLAGGVLAGSVLTMDRAVRNVMRFAQWDLQQALRPATATPARVAGLTNQGTIKAGARADFVALSPTGDVRNTIVGGAGI